MLCAELDMCNFRTHVPDDPLVTLEAVRRHAPPLCSSELPQLVIVTLHAVPWPPATAWRGGNQYALTWLYVSTTLSKTASV